MTTDVNEFMDAVGSVTAAKFEKVGATVSGAIIAMDVWDQTDIQTGARLTWDDGNPRKQVVITLQTDLSENEEDDGRRRVYAKQPSSMLRAINEARNGARLEIGGTLAVKYTGDGEPPRKGFNAPKLYKARYEPPANPPPPEDEDESPF